MDEIAKAGLALEKVQRSTRSFEATTHQKHKMTMLLIG
jgi:hypothetical protein